MPPVSVRAEALHRESIVVVVHDHLALAEDIPRMVAGGVTAKVHQIAIDVEPELGFVGSRLCETGWLTRARDGMLDALRAIETCGECSLALSADDVYRAKESGRVAIFLGAEGTRWLEGRLEHLHEFYEAGLRELQLYWSYPNAVIPNGRLSSFGREVIAECDRLGVIVDLTHLPSAAFDDVLEAASGPVIVSHGTAAGVTLDLTDSQIRDVASSGGLVGVHFFTSYLGPSPSPENVARQVEYIAELIGVDHIALGVDFFPTGTAWKELQLSQGTDVLEWAIESYAEMPSITEALSGTGLHREQIQKVLGLNFLRICSDVFAV